MLSDRPTSEVFSWRAHPARERGRGTVMASIIIGFVCMAVWLSFGLVWAAGAAVIMTLALNRFFFPSRFMIDCDGITAKYLLRKQHFRWAELRRFVHDEYGGYLSRRARRSSFDAYSGMHVLFGNQRDGVIDRIRAHMNEGSDGGGQSCLP